MRDDVEGARQESPDKGDGSDKRRKSGRGRLLWLLGVAILAAGATVYAVPVLDRLEEQRTEIAESTAELDILVAENTELRERLDSLNTPIEIERLARERLGYVRAGETAFLVVSPREEPADTPVGDEEVVETDPVGEYPWYRQWWDYISGSDLTADS